MENKLHLEWLTPCSDGLREDSITVTYDPTERKFIVSFKTDGAGTTIFRSREEIDVGSMSLAILLDKAGQPGLAQKLTDFFDEHLHAQKTC
jgi:hypothetical protein